MGKDPAVSIPKNLPPYLDPNYNPPLRIAICVPMRDDCESPFAYDLAKLYAYSTLHLVVSGAADLSLFKVQGTLVDNARFKLTQEALLWNATHIFWLDSDMQFPKDALIRLLARKEDIVLTNYVGRRPPRIGPIAFKKLSPVKGQPHERLWTDDSSTGLEEVEAAGFGVALTKSGVFAKIGPPGFQTIYDKETGRWTGEDVFFCLRAREAGYKIYVDQDLSKEVGHIGRMEYTHYHAEAIRHMDDQDLDADVEQGPETPKLVGLDGKPLSPLNVADIVL